MPKEPVKPGEAPRPSSLRSLVAWFFVLSFGDYEDGLNRSSAVEVEGPSAFESRLRQLVWWPPDVFAITSSVLKRTGTYRLIVGPDTTLGQHLWRRLDWAQRVEAHAEAWRRVISQEILEPLDLEKAKSHKDLRKGKNISYQAFADNELWEKLDKTIKDRCGRRGVDEQGFPFIAQSAQTFDKPGGHNNLLKAFIRDIVQLRDDDGYLADQNLLAVSVKADTAIGSAEPAARFFEAIIGLHILSDAASGSIGMPRNSTNESAVFDGFANVLLTLRGSLSTAPKFFGVVLPKMRTPQKGLTLRNLSHNLTYHDCEVEVMWRSFPWANFDENTLNVLYVPHPFNFNPNCFKSDTQHYESVGYFTYDPGPWDEVGKAVKLIDELITRGFAPHILVFTETAFDEATYTKLLHLLSASYGSKDPQKMPVVVAGVSRRDSDKGLIYNELRLATHFAGKWYELSQQKHHRWQLDERQIRQYGLQGHFSTARPLFERNVVGQRRLTFYAPTPWLVLCPLICEDLARIEPASELIRGIGPTLVLALLLDGPQMKGRWPDRYATVLADDPGTGVLTVTSYGAANASRPEEFLSTPTAGDAEHIASQPVVVASWKDATSPFIAIPASKNQALLVTLTARTAKEFTLDGRASDNKAASFHLDGVKTFDLPEEHDEKLEIDPRGSWSDIREVTALTYVASAALSLLRPHRSHHPVDAMKYTDKWSGMWDWNRRCLRVRQLIDVMLGRPVFSAPAEWERQTKEFIASTRGRDRLTHDRIGCLKARRSLLLREIFSDQRDGDKRASNRHLFAVMGSSQNTRDIEVGNEKPKWPTDSLRYVTTVLRILLDTIAGKDVDENLTVRPRENPKASMVYRNRLIIAGSSNRLGDNRASHYANVISEGGIDVRAAPKSLTSYKDGSDQPVQYLKQFQLEPPASDEPDYPNGNPSPYDFYRMVLELIYGILNDKEAALWKKAEKSFVPDSTEQKLEEKEMRRLTLLILMMIPALIHEQLEFDYVRLKERNETAVCGVVIYSLMQKSREILTEGAMQARLP